MSALQPQLLQNLAFYLSGPKPCPYLSGQIERKLFTSIGNGDPAASAQINSALCRAGFRRSQTVIYRPACNACTACVPVRIPVSSFSLSRSLRRVEARNRDLHIVVRDPVPTPELFALFSAYQKARHYDSDMANMEMGDFEAMLSEGRADTHLHCLLDDKERVAACMIADHVSDGLSAVYSFFDAQGARRSLGSALVLALINEAKERSLPYVYLGYWIEGARKMLYKNRFRPMQALGQNGWLPLEAATKEAPPLARG